MGVRFTGAWDFVTRALAASKNWLVGPAVDELIDFGEMIRKSMIQHMDDSTHAPNAPSTIRKKGHDRVWMETEFMEKEGIEITVPSKGRFGRASVFVVASEEKRHPRTGETANQILFWMEFGTKRMPSRPIIHPTVMDIRKGGGLFEQYAGRVKAKIRL